MTTIPHTLSTAADLIDARSWAGRGDQPDPWGGGAATAAPLCMEGALLAASGVSLPAFDGTLASFHARDALLTALASSPAYRAVAEFLNLSPGRRLSDWNDAEGRTAVEVVAVLRATALVESARESAAVSA